MTNKAPKLNKMQAELGRLEHVIQFPLMDGCFLNLQINKIAGLRWSIGFSADEMVYPIPNEAAQSLLHLAGNKVPASWTRRMLSEEEMKIITEQAHACPCDSEKTDCDLPAVKANVEQFVTDMGEVWNEKQPQILDMIRKLNDVLNNNSVPVMEAVFSLAMATLMGALTVGAHAPHIASLVMTIAENVNMHVEHIPIQPTTGGTN